MSTNKLILKKMQIEAMEGEIKTHFLNSNAVRLNKSLGDAVGLSKIGVHMIYVEPGKDTTEYHKHLYEEECIYVLSGQGKLTIEEQDFTLKKGDFVGFPANTVAHALINNGSNTLICLIMGQRLEQDIADYPHQKKRLYRNSGEWNLVDLENIVDIK